MIALTDNIPPIDTTDVAMLKICCAFDCYKDIAFFWRQDGDKCYIAMLDGNMFISNRRGNTEELREFVSIINPSSVFSDITTLRAIGYDGEEEISVMCRKVGEMNELCSDEAKSDEIYRLLSVDGLSLPPFEGFAVDFCHRLNRGKAAYFVKKGLCAAVSFNSGDYALLNGIASHKKGFGKIALDGILARNQGKTMMACSKDSLSGFYEKQGFQKIYKSAYWVRKNEFF